MTYAITIQGTDAVAHATARLCQRSGFQDVALQGGHDPQIPPYLTLPANQTRILQAMGCGDVLQSQGFEPDREQVRLAASQYLISEMPLGKFYRDRYGAPLVNLSYAALKEALQTDLPECTAGQTELVIHTNKANVAATQSWELRHHRHLGATSTANVTWLAKSSVAWQFSTPDAVQYYVLVPAGAALDEGEWSPDLWPAIAKARPVAQFAYNPEVRKDWVAGNWAFLGLATMGLHPIRRETWFTGLEDAWVLSRMLENYEEAVTEGLRAYTQYRQPRADRIWRSNVALTELFFAKSPMKRLGRNVGIALRSRFVPEIAMQRIDWFNAYDCIKGFS